MRKRRSVIRVHNKNGHFFLDGPNFLTIFLTSKITLQFWGDFSSLWTSWLDEDFPVWMLDQRQRIVHDFHVFFGCKSLHPLHHGNLWSSNASNKNSFLSYFFWEYIIKGNNSTVEKLLAFINFQNGKGFQISAFWRDLKHLKGVGTS